MFDGIVHRLVMVHAVLHRALVSWDQILQQAGPADAQGCAYGRTHRAAHGAPSRAPGETTADHRDRVPDAVAQLVEPTSRRFGLGVRVGGESVPGGQLSRLTAGRANARDQPAEEAGLLGWRCRGYWGLRSCRRRRQAFFRCAVGLRQGVQGRGRRGLRGGRCGRRGRRWRHRQTFFRRAISLRQRVQRSGWRCRGRRLARRQAFFRRAVGLW
jgi:hypothetical protein